MLYVSVCCSVSTSCLTLWDPKDCSCPGSSVPGISQARILEGINTIQWKGSQNIWVAVPSSRGSSRPKDQTHISYVSCIGRQFSTTSATWEAPFSHFSSVQSLIRVRLFVTPWTAAHQASLSITNFWSLPKLTSFESVMPSNHLILCHPLLLLPSIFPSIRVFSNGSPLCIR